MNLNNPANTDGQPIDVGSKGFSLPWSQFFSSIAQILKPIQNTGSSAVYTPLTGSTISVPDGVETVVAEPAGALASLTLALPTQAQDGQPVYFSATKAISSLTVTATTPTSVPNSSVSLAAGQAVAYRYVASTNKWYRII